MNRKDIYIQDVEDARDGYLNTSAAQRAIDSLTSYGVDEESVELLQEEFWGAQDIEGIEEHHDAMESLINRAALVLDGYGYAAKYRAFS